MTLTIEPHLTSFILQDAGKPLQTPGKNPLCVPTRALAQAIASEWSEHKKYSALNMPLTTLAYTSIDRIAQQEGNIIEALLVYIDTDTLSYRASSSEKLAQLQNQQWGAILAWAKKHYGITWEVTSGVMPVEQPQALSHVIEKRLKQLNSWELSALCVLASGFSSLALMLAVLEKHIDANEAFRLSRLEETAQAEQWGVDAEASGRAEKLREEILEAERFLGLLN